MVRLPVLITALLVIFSTSCSKDKTEVLTAAASGQGIIGSSLPAMIVPAYHNGQIKDISLSSLRGRWVILFFYPADFTFVCPTELKELADFYEDFKKAGAEVLSVSTDSVYSHKAWRETADSLKGISYPMLSDRSGRLSRALGIYDESTGAAHRATFLYDPDGKAVAVEIHHDSIGRSAGELLRKLDAASAVRSGGGGLCPAGWKSGDEMLYTDKK
jgi:peroxiredoxin (alkyl hydroperoxide reductase subunit C)